MKVAQSCPTLCDSMDYTVHGILQARMLGWVIFPFSRGSSQTRNQTQVSGIAGGFFTSWATREAPGQYISAEGRGSCVCYFILTGQTNSNVPFNFLLHWRTDTWKSNNRDLMPWIQDGIFQCTGHRMTPGCLLKTNILVPQPSSTETESRESAFWQAAWKFWHTHLLELPRRLSIKETACQCRRHGRRRLDSWVGKMPWRKRQPTPVF